MNIQSLEPVVPSAVQAKELIDRIEKPLKLQLLTAGVSVSGHFSEAFVQRPQFALTGYSDNFEKHRVQLLGNGEFGYLLDLDEADALDSFSRVALPNVPCIVCTSGHVPTDDMLRVAKERGVAVYATERDTISAVRVIERVLDALFAPRLSAHGSFVDVYGVGILFTGRSGIGKSEVALDLVERGHRLVADDVVLLMRRNNNVIMGTSNSLVRHFMEIRGLGFIDVERMFGMRAIRYQKRLEIIVELEEWDPKAEYTRTGLQNERIKILGASVVHIKLPIFPGKNITVIAETIALNYLLKVYGYNAAETFSDKLRQQMDAQSNNPGIASQWAFPYFDEDFE